MGESDEESFKRCVQMKKRICFIVDSIFSIGGVQRVTAVIAKQLAKENEIAIVTFDHESDMNIKLYGLHEASIQYRFFSYPSIGALHNKIYKAYSYLYLKYRPKSRWTSNLYGYSSFPSPYRKALIKELQDGNYDVIIGVHAPLAGRLATMKPHLHGVKTIGWIHNSYEALFGEKFIYIGAARKRHYVYQFRKLDDVIVLCQHDADLYREYDSKFHPTVIYNPLTLIPGKRSEGNSHRFLAVGRFSHHHKGFDLLIEAFHLFAQHDSDWKLDIVGEGVEEELYRSLIQKYHLEDRVFIHPFTNNIQDYYSKAQVYVLSSRWEGFGLVLVEAMAHGLPVISSDLPTSKEIMGDFALYFKNGDIEDLAQRLEDATQLDWQTKSKEALHISERFDINTITEQWKQLIES